MSKVTSKLQITIPKALAERLGLRPGDAIDWLEREGIDPDRSSHQKAA